jgi:hypothetical protein
MKSLPLSCACLLALHALARAVTPDDSPDFYAHIAQQPFGVRAPAAMERPGPPILPEVTLPWNGGRPVAPMDKLDSPQKLAAALAELRARMAPFLDSHAPALPETRVVVPVTRMDFRLETDEDRADFLYTLQGKGIWKEVAIPHYTGPGEQAVCYYRSTFNVTPEMRAMGRLVIHFNGVDYFADVSVNGHHVGGHEGYFAPFECDFTPYAKTGENVLLVQVRNSSRLTVGSSPTAEKNNRSRYIPRTYGDKLQASNSPGWDDPDTGWNGTPNGFGICQGVTIEARSAQWIGDIFARPILSGSVPGVELNVEVANPDEQNGAVRLTASIYGRNFEGTAVKDLAFTYQPDGAKRPGGPALCKVTGTRPVYRLFVPMPGARLWTLDQPWLYEAQVTLADRDGRTLDAQERQFGMRSFEQRLDSTPIGRFYLNGQEIRLHGANEMGNYQLDVLRRDWKQLIDDILLAKLTNMNFLRCTQTVMPPEFYDYCDRLGFMAQSDLPLFAVLTHKKATEAMVQAGDMARIVRGHPSNCVVTFFNEPTSGDGTDKRADALTRAQIEEFFKAATVAVKLENPDQVIKLIDGDYNPPSAGEPDNHCYSGWYGNNGVALDLLHEGHWCSVLKGWMYGCGEFGAEGLDPVNTMLKYYPKPWVTAAPDGSWKPDKIEGSQTWSMYKAWYEAPRTMGEWVKLSQIHQANVIKLKTEAFRRMPRMNTFAIHLFIDAWPNGWMKAIMDVQRQPKLAWYAYRDALTPLAVQIRSPWNAGAPKLNINNCDTWSSMKNAFVPGKPARVELWICNDLPHPPACDLCYQVEVNGRILESGRTPAQIPTVTEGSSFQGYLPIAAPPDDKARDGIIRASLVEKSSGTTIDQYNFPCHFLKSSN